MKKNRFPALILAFALAFCLAACGGSSGTSSHRPAENESTGAADTGAAAAELPGLELPADRKIIYTADLTLECTSLTESLAAIERAVAQAGGYIQSSDISEYSTRHYAHLTARIPAENYPGFLAGAGAFGNLTHRSEDTQDVTLDYLDVEARLSALEGQRERLLTLRDEATDLDALLAIEAQLADVQYQLERIISQRNLLENQVSYCTVNFELSQPVVMSPRADDFGAKLGTAFARGANNFIEFLQDLVLWVAENLFFLLLLALVVVILVLVRRKHPKARPARKKKQKTAEPPPPEG